MGIFEKYRSRHITAYITVNPRKYTKIITLFAAIISFSVANATLSYPDSLITLKSSETKIIYIDGKPMDAPLIQRDRDSIQQVVKEFYYDQFRSFQDPDAPHFLFMSKDAQLAMGIGGGVFMTMYYDWNGAVSGPAFSPYTIPIPKDPTSMKRFVATPALSNIFFRVIGRHQLIGNYQLYIETNFTGYKSEDLKLKKAYAMIGDVTFGYASSTFSDGAAEAPLIGAPNPANGITRTAVLLRYMPCVKEHWYFGISAETPSSAIDDTNPNLKPVSNWLPDGAALVQYEWAKGQHVRISTIFRNLAYRDLIAEKNHNCLGWGLQLSSVAHPTKQITTYLMVNGGQGYGGLNADLGEGNYDLMFDPMNPQRMYAPGGVGWHLGIQYNFRPNLFVSASFSQQRLIAREGTPGNEYQRGEFAAVNLFWNIRPRFQVAAELDWGQRTNINRKKGHSYRAGIMAAFTF